MNIYTYEDQARLVSKEMYHDLWNDQKSYQGA